jgi:multidrug efflux system membrane fusion protein
MDFETNDSPAGRQVEISKGGRKPPAGLRRRPRLWLWSLAALLAGASLFGLKSLFAQTPRGRGAAAGAAARAVPVIGAAARSADFPVYLSGLGTVIPLKTVTIRTRVDGQIVNIAFREGQSVREGDLLVEIDPRPFDVLLHQAEGQMAKDQASLANAKVDLKRYEALIKDDSIARQQLDTQAVVVLQSEAAIKSDQAQVDSAKLSLTYSRITAPIPGIVGLRLVDLGNIVHAGDATGLLVITQQQPITAVFTLASIYLSKILPPLRAGTKLAVEAWDTDLTHKLADGSVLALDNQIDSGTFTIRIKALFANTDFALFPNQPISAKLIVDTLRHAVVIPTAALQRSPQSTYVFVVKPDQTVEIRNVDVQLTQGDDSAIRQGLSPGEIVVVDGVDKLQAGTRVAMAGEDNPTGSGTRKRSS